MFMVECRGEVEATLGGGSVGLAKEVRGAGKHIGLTTRVHSQIVECWTLSKPDVNFLIALTTYAGFYLGRAHQRGPFPVALLAFTMIGTLLVASGTACLNQYIERCFDARMRRTANRPLAAGRLSASAGLTLGISSAVIGCIVLASMVNLLATALAVLTLSSYLGVYTPLKRISPVSMPIGAIPGAIPPLIGWAAATDHLSSQALILFGIQFLWQFPHFMAIAWMYRDDYQRAGFRILPATPRKNAFVNWMIIVPLLLLIPLTFVPIFLERANLIYAVCAGLAVALFLCCGSALVLHKSNQRARRLLLASIVYLPVIFGLLIATSRQK
jgi:protoheme IX farnesyltransferase